MLVLAPGDKDKLEFTNTKIIVTLTVTAGDGIVVSTTAGSDPNPTVAVDLVSNQGLEFDTSSRRPSNYSRHCS